MGINGFNAENTNRHMRNRFHFIKQCVEEKMIKLEYKNTNDMVADFFTKPLTGKRFRMLRDHVMGIHESAPIKGVC